MIHIKGSLTNYLRNRTVKNIGFLTVGNGISQIISLIGAFYIPKLLGPEKYGIYQTVIAYVGLFGFLTLSGLNKVLIRECAKDLTKTKKILEDTIGMRNLFSFLAALISLIVVLFIDYDKGTKFFIAIFSVSLIINGFQSSINTIYQSFENMKILAVFSIARQLLIVPLSIFFLKLGYGILSLIIINLVINFIILIINFYYSKKIVVFNIFSKIKFIKYYVKAGFNFTLLQFLNTLSGKIDLVMLSFLTTPQNVGIYALAYRIAEKGLIIRTPISQSLFPYYSRKLHTKSINTRTLFNHALLIIIPSLFIAITVILTSNYIITNLIGKEYAQSAVILNILIFYLIFNYSVIPFGLFLQSSNNEKYVIRVAIVKAILNIIGNLIFFYSFGLVGIAFSTLLNECIGLIIQWNYSRHLLKIKI